MQFLEIHKLCQNEPRSLLSIKFNSQKTLVYLFLQVCVGTVSDLNGSEQKTPKNCVQNLIQMVWNLDWGIEAWDIVV